MLQDRGVHPTGHRLRSGRPATERVTARSVTTRSAGTVTWPRADNSSMEPDPADEIDLTEQSVDLAMMELLRAHVPLSLLIDLAYPEGPHSREILAAEAD